MEDIIYIFNIFLECNLHIASGNKLFFLQLHSNAFTFVKKMVKYTHKSSYVAITWNIIILEEKHHIRVRLSFNACRERTSLNFFLNYVSSFSAKSTKHSCAKPFCKDETHPIYRLSLDKSLARHSITQDCCLANQVVVKKPNLQKILICYFKLYQTDFTICK